MAIPRVQRVRGHTTMDNRSTDAILDWLAIGGDERKRMTSEMIEDPLSFFKQHLNVLPGHLLVLFDTAVSRRQRGQLASIRDRRRHFASKEQPEELGVEETRSRDPLLYKDVVGSIQSTQRSQRAPESGAEASLATPEQVLSRPRFAALVDRLDDDDVAYQLQRQEELRAETTAETEEEDDDDDDDGEDNGDDEAYVDDEQRRPSHQKASDLGRLVLDRFIRGDDTLPAELYQCDFDERWDEEADSAQQVQSGRMLAVRSEEQWFDDEEPS